MVESSNIIRIRNTFKSLCVTTEKNEEGEERRLGRSRQAPHFGENWTGATQDLVSSAGSYTRYTGIHHNHKTSLSAWPKAFLGGGGDVN